MRSLFPLFVLLVACLPGIMRVPARAGGVESNYVLTPNDLVRISVFQEEDMTTEARIASDGTVTFPLIGVVRLGGKTVIGAQKTIRDLLDKDYLVNPQVTVSVQEFTKRRFTILGQVNNAGTYDIPANEKLTLLDAVGLAGGFTRIANTARVTLKRAVGGKESVIKLDAKRMAREEGNSFEVKDGDTITVPESIF